MFFIERIQVGGILLNFMHFLLMDLNIIFVLYFDYKVMLQAET
jgi:hypothetical protein